MKTTTTTTTKQTITYNTYLSPTRFKLFCCPTNNSLADKTITLIKNTTNANTSATTKTNVVCTTTDDNLNNYNNHNPS